ncbi:MAG TPA: enoyl-CoA hydratase-related protein [Kofleriaceae bacterium]|nr:enoyl-CoA hydratase-related protein [Kofleriaceae bacterium]
MSSNVLVSIDGGVMTIQMDRLAKKNAIDAAMYRGLADGLAAAAADKAVRATIITGGPDVFCAGNDLADFARARAGGGDMAASDFLRNVSQHPKPLIGAVAGWAVGIGTTMLLHCDFVYAAPSARFRAPFVDLGLCPEAASTVLLPRIIGPRHAAEMLYLGVEVNAANALAWGLVNEIVEDPQARAREVAATIARRSPGAVRATKALLARVTAEEVASAMAAELAAFAERLHSDEAVEAATALMAKRAPDFSRF